MKRISLFILFFLILSFLKINANSMTKGSPLFLFGGSYSALSTTTILNPELYHSNFELKLFNIKNKIGISNIFLFQNETKKEKKINFEYIFAAGVVLQSIAALIAVSFLPVLVMGIIRVIDFQDKMGFAPRELADDLAYFLTFGIALSISFAIQIPAVPLMVIGKKKN